MARVNEVSVSESYFKRKRTRNTIAIPISQTPLSIRAWLVSKYLLLIEVIILMINYIFLLAIVSYESSVVSQAIKGLLTNIHGGLIVVKGNNWGSQRLILIDGFTV